MGDFVTLRENCRQKYVSAAYFAIFKLMAQDNGNFSFNCGEIDNLKNIHQISNLRLHKALFFYTVWAVPLNPMLYRSCFISNC
jgi:hypothetical protein